MFVDLWVFAILSITVGFCAVWNRFMGFRSGVISTIQKLEEDKIVKITEEGEIIPYRKSLS